MHHAATCRSIKAGHCAYRVAAVDNCSIARPALNLTQKMPVSCKIKERFRLKSCGGGTSCERRSDVHPLGLSTTTATPCRVQKVISQMQPKQQQRKMQEQQRNSYAVTLMS